MVFIGLNYVLGRHISGHREQQYIENVSNKGNAVMTALYAFWTLPAPKQVCVIARLDAQTKKKVRLAWPQ